MTDPRKLILPDEQLWFLLLELHPEITLYFAYDVIAVTPEILGGYGGECSICLRRFFEPDGEDDRPPCEPTQLPCEHVFGSSCLDKHRRRTNDWLCPLCRQQAPVNNIVTVKLNVETKKLQMIRNSQWYYTQDAWAKRLALHTFSKLEIPPANQFRYINMPFWHFELFSQYLLVYMVCVFSPLAFIYSVLFLNGTIWNASIELISSMSSMLAELLLLMYAIISDFNYRWLWRIDHRITLVLSILIFLTSYMPPLAAILLLGLTSNFIGMLLVTFYQTQLIEQQVDELGKALLKIENARNFRLLWAN